MCGRFFVDSKNREIDRLLDLLPVDSPPVKTGEVYPSDTALIIASRGGEIRPFAMGWGFPKKDGKGLIINARSETVGEKPFFRYAARNNPLLIPATGFYEWETRLGEKNKIKYLFKNRDQELLYLAGFWREFPAEATPRFVILTAGANDAVKFCHDRMPVIVREDERESWLGGFGGDKIFNRDYGDLLAKRE